MAPATALIYTKTSKRTPQHHEMGGGGAHVDNYSLYFGRKYTEAITLLDMFRVWKM